MERTLEEAIKYYSELAEENEKDAEQFKRLRVTQDVISYCYECAAEHRQLAEWLRELKNYKTYVAKYPCEVCTYKSKVGCGRQTCIFKEVKADE